MSSILPDLVTSHNISLQVYFGEYDFLLNHFSAELTLHNMAWNGAQGFSSPITQSFYSDNAAPRSTKQDSETSSNSGTPTEEEAGKRASERGVTYHLFRGAGHSVFLSKPREMFAYVRNVVFAKSPLPDTT
ncbi:hypothetical protein BDV06DRAFT_219870 [Aspergillus oleicola]